MRTLAVSTCIALGLGVSALALPGSASAGVADQETWFRDMVHSGGPGTRAERRGVRETSDFGDEDRPQRGNRIARAERSWMSESLSGGQTGVASYYWQGQRVASGGRFNPNAMTAAHKTLPFGTRVRVTRVDTGRSVTVTINDRGPFVRGRIIDLSRAAAGSLGMTGAGVARVSLTVLGR